MSFLEIASEISSASGPELPMQLVQPKPTRLKPSLSSSFCRPDLSRYSAPTWRRGGRVFFPKGWGWRLLAAAFLESGPAATITFGFDVLVQDVIAAITTSPW